MSAAVILFPAARRIGFIRKQAATVAGYGEASRRRTIDYVVERQRSALLSKGVDGATVEQHLDELRGCILAALPTARKA